MFDMPPVTINGTEYIEASASTDAIQHDANWSCIVATVRPGDRAPYDVRLNRPFERAELISDTPFPFGKPATMSFFQYIAPGSEALKPVIIGQMHNSAETEERALQPVIAMQINGGVQRIITRSVAERYATAIPEGIVRWSAPVETGRWVHWIWQVTPDPVKGRMRIWRNGVKVFDDAIPVGFNDPRGPYFQFGIYRAADTTTMRVAYADVRVRLAAVDPGEWGAKMTSTGNIVPAPLVPPCSVDPAP